VVLEDCSVGGEELEVDRERGCEEGIEERFVQEEEDISDAELHFELR